MWQWSVEGVETVAVAEAAVARGTGMGATGTGSNSRLTVCLAGFLSIHGMLSHGEAVVLMASVAADAPWRVAARRGTGRP